MSGARWFGHLPTQVELDCSGERHWVRWEDGRLFALNHADAEGERTLAAIAGERPPCIELLDLWARHEDDPRVLVLASRGPGDTLHRQDLGQQSGGWVATAPAARPFRAQIGGGVTLASSGLGSVLNRPRPGIAPRRTPLRPGGAPMAGAPVPLPFSDPLLTLMGLAGPLVDRLVAAVATTWAERVESGDERTDEHRAALAAALYGRAALSVRTWLGAPRIEVSVRMIPPHEQPAIARNEDGVELSLPFRWVADVWARGLAVLLGRFVLSVSQVAEDRLLLVTSADDFAGTSTMELSL